MHPLGLHLSSYLLSAVASTILARTAGLGCAFGKLGGLLLGKDEVRISRGFSWASSGLVVTMICPQFIR